MAALSMDLSNRVLILLVLSISAESQIMNMWTLSLLSDTFSQLCATEQDTEPMLRSEFVTCTRPVFNADKCALMCLLTTGAGEVCQLTMDESFGTTNYICSCSSIWAYNLIKTPLAHIECTPINEHLHSISKTIILYRNPPQTVLNDNEVIESIKRKGSSINFGICNENVQLLPRYQINPFTALSELECQQKCISLRQQNVNIGGDVTEFTNSGQCHCANIKARYLYFLPRRYLQCTNESSSILFSNESLWTNWTTVRNPYLFYALDDITKTTNLGRLEGDQQNAVWVNGGEHYDCLPKYQSSTSYLRFIATEQSCLQSGQSFLLSAANGGFTIMMWMKLNQWLNNKDTLISTALVNDFHIRLSSATQIHFHYSQTYNSPQQTLSTGNWYHVALIVYSDSFYAAVNGEFFSKVSLSSSISGDKLWIGSNQCTGNYFDGCISHVAVFNGPVLHDSVKIVATLFEDELF